MALNLWSTICLIFVNGSQNDGWKELKYLSSGDACFEMLILTLNVYLVKIILQT